jgi:hypothetical protein
VRQRDRETEGQKDRNTAFLIFRAFIAVLNPTKKYKKHKYSEKDRQKVRKTERNTKRQRREKDRPKN